MHIARMLGEKLSLLILSVTRLTSLTEHPNRDLAGSAIHYSVHCNGGRVGNEGWCIAKTPWQQDLITVSKFRSSEVLEARPFFGLDLK